MEEFFTKKGLKQLKTELEELKTVKKWEIAEWLREAATQGDMDENAEYLAAKEAQTALENRIEELEQKIRSAKVITRRKKDIVDVGAKVEFATSSNNKNKVMLVSTEEADASDGKISFASPLGKALMGRKVGEHVEVHTPKGKKKYKITKIV